MLKKERHNIIGGKKHIDKFIIGDMTLNVLNVYIQNGIRNMLADIDTLIHFIANKLKLCILHFKIKNKVSLSANKIIPKVAKNDMQKLMSIIE